MIINVKANIPIIFMINKTITFKFKKLDNSYLDDLISIQDEAFKFIENEEILRKNSRSVLLDCLTNHYTLGAFHKNKLVAFSILFFGKDTKENLGHNLDLDSSLLSSVVNVKLIIVKKHYRGHSLQFIFINKLEKIAKTMGYKILAATISPLNIYSIKNFLKADFIFHKETLKYGGLKRNIYYKTIA